MIQILKDTHPIEVTIQAVEKLLNEANLTLDYYAGNLRVTDKKTKQHYEFVDADNNTPISTLPRSFDSERLKVIE